ncbi:HK97 family phage prohead protease [Microbacterium trichothecenolyticum]|uniref:HK97 family phage prohead protease n=1 Tax=Microbacterium trichothecenolyticum TaxID=69370 RepID=UPI001C6F2AB3|nr:HK97 family phage prohead protease [Microbacterium trichothecenolyticum]MBW9118879.1 HK97 family phage prohead protease [Microbacterium trichothecenolyticum]
MNDAAALRLAAAGAGTLRSLQDERVRRRFASPGIQVRKVQKDGADFVELDGYATVFSKRYKMWDWYGEYEEEVAPEALDRTLGEDPDVNFLVNHTGLAMARTKAGTLTLTADETGLRSVPRLNPARGDVQDLLHALDDGAVDEMSFAFRIVDGRWSANYSVYTITEIDIDRGDVSAVNYGANPYTSISARSQQAFDALEHLDGAPLAEVARRAQERLAAGARRGAAIEPPAAAGRSKRDVLALLDADLI